MDSIFHCNNNIEGVISMTNYDLSKGSLKILTKRNISKLSRILKVLDRRSSIYLILSLVNEYSETNPELIKLLRREFLDIEYVFEEIDNKDLQVIFSVLTDEDIAYIVGGYEKLVERIIGNLPRRRKEDIEKLISELTEKEKNEKRNIIMHTRNFFKTLLDLTEKKKIQYCGLLSLFTYPECCAVKNEHQSTAFIITEKEYYTVNEPISIFVYAPKTKSNVLKIFRTNEDRKETKIELNEYSESHTKIKGFFNEGVYTLLVKSMNNVIATLDVCVLSEKKSLLRPVLIDMKSNTADDTVRTSIKAKLVNKDKTYKGNISYIVLCADCGNIVDGGFASCADGVFNISFISANHNGKFIIETQTDKGNISTLITPTKKYLGQYQKITDDELVIKSPKEVKFGDDVTIDINAEKNKKVITILTNKDNNIDVYKEMLSLSGINGAGSIDKLRNKRIREHYLTEKINLKNKSSKVYIDFHNLKAGANHIDYTSLFIGDNFYTKGFKFYVFEWRPETSNYPLVCEEEIVVSNKNNIRFDLPSYVENKEYYYGNVLYYADDPSTLLVKNGETKKYDIHGRGKEEIKITYKENVEAEIIPQENNDKNDHIKINWNADYRKRELSSYILLRPDDKPIKMEDNCDYYLYVDIDSMIHNSIKALLKYKWGCAEQTSSKLNGLAFLLKRLQHNEKIFLDETAITIPMLLSRMKDGFDTLLSYENNSRLGLYGLFSSDSPSINISLIVYKNIKIYETLKISDTELYKTVIGIIGRIKKAIRENNKDIIDDINTVEKAYDAYNSKMINTKQKALDFIKSKAKTDKYDRVYFEGVSMWGGNKYITLLALEVLIKENIEELEIEEIIKKQQVLVEEKSPFRKILQGLGLIKKSYEEKVRTKSRKVTDVITKGLNYVCESIGNDGLVPTQTIVTLVNVLKLLSSKYKGKPRYIVDDNELGVITEKYKVDSTKQEIRVKSGIGIINKIKRVELSREDKIGQNISLNYDIRKGNLNIKFNKVPATPILRLYLPGHLEVSSKSNIIKKFNQMSELLVRRREINISMTHKRKGMGYIIAELGDMYRPEFRSITTSEHITIE